MGLDKQLIDSLEAKLGVKASELEFSQDIVDKVVDKYIRIWQNNLFKNNHMASDNLWQSIGDKEGQYGFRVESKTGITRLYLSLPDYYEYTDTGRQPTKNKGTGVVRQKLQGLQGWISQKGLKLNLQVKGKYKLKDGTIKEYTRKLTKEQANKQAAFFIARKIHTKGFKGTNWFSSEIDNFKREVVNAIRIDTGVMVELIIEKIKKDTTQK